MDYAKCMKPDIKGYIPCNPNHVYKKFKKSKTIVTKKKNQQLPEVTSGRTMLAKGQREFCR